VHDLKAAGLGVGVAVLVGAGGLALADEHESATGTLLASIGLGPGDLVSLLDAREFRDGNEEMPSLDAERHAAQSTGLRQRLASLRDERVKVVPYSLEKQASG
jgi:hypothetical protein